MSAITDSAGAVRPASPAPTPKRISASCQKFDTMPHAAVKPLHTTHAIPISFTRFQRSAIIATGLQGRKNRIVIGLSPPVATPDRSEEHTSELQSLMRISYAVFCLQNKKHQLATKI